MMKTLGLGCAAVALLGVAPASAATLFSQPLSTGITESPGSRTYQFGAGGGTGTIAFELEGYRTLDGQGTGSFDDLFTLTLNGTVLSSAYFILGGGGNNVVVSGAAPVSVVGNSFGNGGLATYAINNVALASGNNTLTFSYFSSSPQGTGDEGWGLRNVLVTGNPVNSAVPEPATWATMMLGFGLVGAAMRRRRQTVRVRFA